MKYQRTIAMKYLGATNYSGARIKLTDHRFDGSITIARDYEFDAGEQAILYLERVGIGVESFSSLKYNGEYIYLTDNFSTGLKGEAL